jgi:hypothetical protein
MALIKVNGLMVNPEKVTMLERKSGRRYSDKIGNFENYAGVIVHFDAGGHTFIEEPDAAMLEAAFESWDRDRPLPY